MKLLNLDDLQAPTRVVTLNKVDYAIREQSVGSMITSLQMAELVDDTKKQDPTAMFSKMVDVAISLIPECPDSVVRGMSIRQLSALIEFASASDEQVVEGSEEEGAKGQKK